MDPSEEVALAPGGGGGGVEFEDHDYRRIEGNRENTT